MPSAEAVAPLVSVILPTYNERENIAPLLERLERVMRWPWEALVVDDDSPDGTAAEAARIAEERTAVRVIVRRERGLTGAIQRGIDESRGTVLVWMDCDLSMPPEVVPALVAPVLSSSADAAIGSRWVAGSRAEAGGRDGPLVRAQKLLTGGMNHLFARLTRAGLSDWTSGFIAVRAGWVRGTPLEGRHGEYFIQLAARLVAGGARIVEVPYHCVPRAHGESKTAPDPAAFLRLGARYLAALWKAGRHLSRRDVRAAR